MHECTLEFRFRMRLAEVSALATRRAGDGTELLAVGDRKHGVLSARLHDAGLNDQTTTDVGHALKGHRRGGSQWEALATDATGRLFVVAEDDATLIVLAPQLNRTVRTLHLRAEQGPDERAAVLLGDDNRGPEGLLLLRDGHILATKERKPVLLIEFGPSRERPLGLDASAHLPPDEEFRLPDGEASELFPLRSWALSHGDEEAVESANDLAVDARGGLYAISSRSRCIYELGAVAREDRATVGRRWRLPPVLEASNDRKAEGLTFDRSDRPIVALDIKDSNDNGFVLQPLRR